MATAVAGIDLCRHIAGADNAPLPFETAIVLDDQSGITDAVVACSTCGQCVLIEMLDWGGERFSERVYRTSLVDPDAVAHYAHDRTRGSCDVRRAGAEAHAFTNLAQLTPWLIALDLANLRQIGAIRLPEHTDIPLDSWREAFGRGTRKKGEWLVHFTRSSTRIE